MNHTHIHTLRHAPPFSHSAYTNSKPQIIWNNAFSVFNQNHKKAELVYSANCCFNSCGDQGHKYSVREATVEEQLSSKTNHPAMRANLHLPALDLLWAPLRVQLHLPALDLS